MREVYEVAFTCGAPVAFKSWYAAHGCLISCVGDCVGGVESEYVSKHAT